MYVCFITSLVLLALQQGILQDITQRQDALQFAVLVDDDEAVDARLADGVVNGAELVLHGARVDAGEVLFSD